MIGKKNYKKIKVPKMNMGGHTGDMMYSRGYGVGERNKRMPTELMTAPRMKKGGAAKMNKGGKVVKRQGGGTARRNLLEEVGRINAERMNPNRRAEKRRVIGELNRGYKKGGVARMHTGGASRAEIAKANKEKNLKIKESGIKVSTPKHPAHPIDKTVYKHPIGVAKKPSVPTKKGTGASGPGGRYSAGAKLGTGASGPGGRYSKKPSSVAKGTAKDSAIMKAEKARRAKAKKDIPTGRSAAASGYSKRKEIGKRKGYKKHPSRPVLGNR